MDIRPVVIPGELEMCVDVWLRAMNDVGQRQGDPPMSADDVAWLPVSLSHLATSDPGRFLLSLRDGKPVAFGCAFERDDFWFLSELMVLPEAQGAGIGTGLLEALLPDEVDRSTMTLATVVESRQPTSTLLYSRYGMVPRVPLYWMEGIRDPGSLPALADGVVICPLDLGQHGDAIDHFDQAYLGYTRAQDHRMFSEESESAWVYFSADDDVVGYSYVQPEGWLSPVAATDEKLTAGILRSLVEGGHVPEDKVTIQIGGDAGGLLPMLARAGMRCEEGARLIYCSNGSVPPPGYLHFGGYHP